MKTKIVQRIDLETVVAIIRSDNQTKATSTVDSLIESGIKVLEITSNTPGYLDEIGKAREKYPDILIGAGTITNSSLAREAIVYGAQFLVTPNTSGEIVSVAHDANIPVLMGAATATEIALAMEFGADFIKLFPAGALGLDYFKALLGPFDKAKFFVVGGISLSNAAQWLQAGARGIGVGGSLTKSNPEDIKNLLKALFQFQEKYDRQINN